MALGGARPGAGRKTKAEELGLKKTLDEVFTDRDKRDLFSVLLQQAMKGSLPHAQLLLAYYYGKPTEHIINEQDGETIIRIVRNAGDISQPEHPSQSPTADSSGSEAV